MLKQSWRRRLHRLRPREHHRFRSGPVGRAVDRGSDRRFNSRCGRGFPTTASERDEGCAFSARVHIIY